MTNNHTPGPWFCVPNGGDDADDRALLVGKNDEYGDFTTIADCRNRWIEEELGGDAESNARLIAAAPDMLDALKQADAAMHCTSCDNDGRECRHCDGAFNFTRGAVRAAIAKAEGGAK